MQDETILTSLLDGNHLNRKELERAKELIFRMQAEINTRVTTKNY